MKLIIDVMVDPEFCAPDYQYYFAWTGEVLLPLFVLLHDTQLDSDWTVDETRTEKYLGDWYDEYVILPGEGAPDNTMIKVLRTAHKFDDDGWPLDTAYAVEVYAWDGERPVRVSQTAAFKDWRRGE